MIQDINPNLDNQKIYLFADILEKKSKLRSFFEKSKECAAIACYADNEIHYQKYNLRKIKGYDGLTAFNVNLILDHISLDRIKLNNEIEKLLLFFLIKKIKR